MNDVIRKNREVNVIDSLNATAIRRNCGSQLLIKNGSGLDPQRLTGEPGLTHEVQDPYAVRWLHDEMPISPVLPQLRQQLKEDVYEVSGAQDALTGQSDTTANSGYQEKIRQEREERRLSPARRAFESLVEGIGEKITSCVKANAIKLDDSVMGYMKRAGAGEFSANEVISFLSSPIDYGVDIKIVKSSMAIKSKASQQALLQELSQGVLGPRLTNDAKVLDEYLKFFDADTLRDASAAHRDRATRENEVFMDMFRLGDNVEGIAKPIVIFEDDDAIHMAEHQDCYVKNFDEMRNNPTLLFEFIQHQETHRLQMEEKMAKLMPGTSMQTGAMMQQAQGIPPPNLPQVYQGAMARQGLNAGSQMGAPAPSSNGEGGAKIDPNAANTPKGATQGGV
jgi:hypothetical protein